jgi:hypothetical protein
MKLVCLTSGQVVVVISLPKPIVPRRVVFLMAGWVKTMYWMFLYRVWASLFKKLLA